MKDTILLAGIGLIGGSIALAIKKEHPHKRIIGVDISEEQLTAALKLGIIDERRLIYGRGAASVCCHYRHACRPNAENARCAGRIRHHP